MKSFKTWLDYTFVCNRESEALPSERIRRALLVLGIAVLPLAGAACARPADGPASRRAVPSYDLYTGRLVQLSADQNGDGQIDQWTYLDGNRLLRGEADSNGDGRVDRWEYFGPGGVLTHVGSSSLADGIEDTWAWVAPQNGETRIARSRARDRRIDRTEFYRGETRVRAEEDANADGRVDRWERYDGLVLREAAFDTTGRGRADRRLRYDEQGRYEAIEADPEGDGTFVRLTGEAAAKAKAGVPQ
jgi:hypothetical protein